MAEPFRICFNTQTPLVQFLPAPLPAGMDQAGNEVDIAQLREGIDYRYSPGGVTRMVLPLLRRLSAAGVLRDPHWVALNPAGPATVRLPGVTLHNVDLPPARMASYAAMKEAIWARLHGIDVDDHHDDLFWSEAFAEYSFYNRRTTELLRALDGKLDFDAFYIHDFQQLPVGEMLGTLKPKIFRWHIPFDGAAIPEPWRSHVAKYLDAYDVVIVSSDGYARSLRQFDPRARVVRLYPYVDPADYSKPKAEVVASTAEQYGVAADDFVVLVVGRMDPTKGQDRVVRAAAALRKEHPEIRVVLVGNGSFSGSSGGLSLSKSNRWRAELEELAKGLGVADRVVFTGHVEQGTLDALYERADCTVLSSEREGFGLVVVESWLHGTPAVVADRAGIAELVRSGRNGITFDPDHLETLEAALRRLMGPGGKRLSRAIARSGRSAARRCSIEAAVKGERKLIETLVET